VNAKAKVFRADFVGGASFVLSSFDTDRDVLFLLHEVETDYIVLGRLYISGASHTITSSSVISLVNPNNINIAVVSHTWGELDFKYLNTSYNYKIVLIQ
jgi:hypothetical protein